MDQLKWEMASFNVQNTIIIANCYEGMIILWYSMVANSTELVPVSIPRPVRPPTTISWLLGRRAATHRRRGVAMWLITSQESVVELYMWMAVVVLQSESFPPIASSRPWRDTKEVCVTGGAASAFHTPASLFLRLARNNLLDWTRVSIEHVYILDSLGLRI